MSSNPATRMAGAMLAALIMMSGAGCGDPQGLDPADDTPDVDIPAKPLPALIVSDPSRVAQGVSPVQRSGGVDVAWVSLPPGTFPGADQVVIQTRATGSQVWVAPSDGGFDPVAVTAGAGDTLDILVHVSGETMARAYATVVPERRPPVIVRTQPPPRRRDVPFNTAMLVVFSEPMDPATLTPTGIQLRLGSTPVAGTLAFTDATHLAATFTPTTPLAAGTAYSLVVTRAMTDLSGDSLETALTVPFETVAPDSAAFSWFCNGLSCDFSNESVEDPLGFAPSYDWDFGDGGPHATTRDASHTYAAGGQFTVTLLRKEADGRTATHSATVDVTPPPPPPSTPTVSFVAGCVLLDCTFLNVSVYPPGTFTAWDWDFGDGTAHATTHSAIHAYQAAGDYQVTLAGTLASGQALAMTVLVRAEGTSPPPQFPPDPPPSAYFYHNCQDLACAFQDHSYDAGGAVVAFAWDFGDGQTSTTQSPQHTYGAPGTYTVTLTVTDNSGQTGTYSQTLTVPRPRLDFTVTCTGTSCAFSPFNPYGYNLTWYFGDGQYSELDSPVHDYAVTQPTTFTVLVIGWDPFDVGFEGATHDVTVSPAGP